MIESQKNGLPTQNLLNPNLLHTEADEEGMMFSSALRNDIDIHRGCNGGPLTHP